MLGAASDWAEPFALHVTTGLGDDDDSAGDDDDASGSGGCDCESSLGGHSTPAPAWGLLALVGLVGLRRRR